MGEFRLSIYSFIRRPALVLLPTYIGPQRKTPSYILNVSNLSNCLGTQKTLFLCFCSPPRMVLHTYGTMYIALMFWINIKCDFYVFSAPRSIELSENCYNHVNLNLNKRDFIFPTHIVRTWPSVNNTLLLNCYWNVKIFKTTALSLHCGMTKLWCAQILKKMSDRKKFQPS